MEVRLPLDGARLYVIPGDEGVALQYGSHMDKVM